MHHVIRLSMLKSWWWNPGRRITESRSTPASATSSTYRSPHPRRPPITPSFRSRLSWWWAAMTCKNTFMLKKWSGKSSSSSSGKAKSQPFNRFCHLKSFTIFKTSTANITITIYYNILVAQINSTRNCDFNHFLK